MQHAVRVSLETNTVAFRKHALSLPPQEIEFLYAMARRMPQVTLYDTIIAALWGDSEIDHAMNRIKSMVSQLRRKLLPIGLGISNYKERGYRLVVLPQLSRTERSTHGSEYATA